MLADESLCILEFNKKNQKYNNMILTDITIKIFKIPTNKY